MPQRGRPLLKIRSENHWNWQGGKSQDRRDTLNTENNTWRKRVFKRDKYTCKLCGLTSYDGIRLNAHHIRPYKDYNHLRLDVSNGITLCHECHLKTFGKEDDFIDLFSALIANRVNCGDTRPSEVEGNPQPSLGGNTEEGSETRGRDYDLGELEPLRSKMVPCKMCGKMHAKPPHKLKANNNNFCSNECRNKWLGENSVFATDNPNKKAKTEVSCEWCGKKILLSPWQIKKSEHFFCCRPHYWLWKKGRLPKLSQ